MANNLDHLYAALADPTRRAVIARLMEAPATVTDLHDPERMALPSFLKHVRRLEAAGILRSEKTGRSRMLHIEAASLAPAERWLSEQRSLWTRRLDRLDALTRDITGESR